MGTSKNYWLNLFTGTTWQEFLKAGGNVTGFKENRWATTKRIKPGDYLICYVTGISRFISVLEVTSEAFKDSKNKIWEFDTFPSRLQVKTLVKLGPKNAVPFSTLKKRLVMYQRLENPASWGILVRGSPKKLDPEDGELIIKAIYDAQKNPNPLSYDKKKFDRIPRYLRTKNIDTPVTIPDDREDIQDEISVMKNEIIPHTEIQWLLLKFGSDMGFDVWVARNDRNKDYKGNKFSDISGIINDLPLQFDEATTKTIELIDVLWLEGNSIIAAFEIESTTSIYSGLLRMSDLVAMQPNLNIPLYIVAPESRREKVMQEVNRPTFSKLTLPLKEICRYISFKTLKIEIENYKPIIKYIKPEILDEISESCIEEI